jgi:DNA-binding transcriptional LysR family regulator
MDQHLYVFVMVAEKQNFSRAAEELHMTQPAVSQYIRTLEQTMGTRLLERSNKYVRLNKAGEIVYHHAKEILGLYTKMQGLIDDLTMKAKGPLAIGSSYTFGEYVLPHIIARLKKQYPLIQPAITIHNTTEIAELVENHQLDIGIIEGQFNHSRIETRTIAEDIMVIVAPPGHPLSESGEIDIHEAEGETWILREKGSGTREAADNLFQQFGIYPKHVMEFGSTQLIKESVEAGLGISLLSSWTIQKELKNQYVSLLRVKGIPFKRHFSILTNSPFQTKALKTFLEIMEDYLKENEKGKKGNH